MQHGSYTMGDQFVESDAREPIIEGFPLGWREPEGFPRVRGGALEVATDGKVEAQRGRIAASPSG